jgi:hypothetical protein
VVSGTALLTAQGGGSSFVDLSALQRQIHCRRDGPAITRDEGPVHVGAKVLIRQAQGLGAMKGFFP